MRTTWTESWETIDTKYVKCYWVSRRHEVHVSSLQWPSSRVKYVRIRAMDLSQHSTHHVENGEHHRDMCGLTCRQSVLSRKIQLQRNELLPLCLYRSWVHLSWCKCRRGRRGSTAQSRTFYMMLMTYHILRLSPCNKAHRGRIPLNTWGMIRVRTRIDLQHLYVNSASFDVRRSPRKHVWTLRSSESWRRCKLICRSYAHQTLDMCPSRLNKIECVELSVCVLLRLRLLTRLSSISGQSVCPVRDVKSADTRCEVPVAASAPKNVFGDLTKQFKLDHLVIDHLKIPMLRQRDSEKHGRAWRLSLFPLKSPSE